MTSFYRTAIFCGAFPAVLGTVIFFAWVIAPLPIFQLAGLLLILIGIVLFSVGLISLGLHARSVRSAGISRRKEIRWATVLLVSNFPLCAVYLFIWITVSAANFILIKNATPGPIENLVMTDSRGNIFAFLPVPPHTERTLCAKFRDEGQVAFSFDVGGQHRQGLLTSYTSHVSYFELDVFPNFGITARKATDESSVVDYLSYCFFG